MLCKYTKKHSGFTFMEMFVVLLIITLAAIFAWPKLYHAVMMSRFTTLQPLVRRISDAQENFYWRNGRYSSKRDGLPLQSNQKESEEITISFSDKPDYAYVMASHEKVPNAYYVTFLQRSPNFPGNIHCEAKTDDKDAMWLCEEGMIGEKLEQASLMGEGYTSFILSGSPTAGWIATDYQGSSNVALNHGDSCASGGTGGCNSVVADDHSTCTVDGSGSGCNDSTFSNGSTCDTQTGKGAGCKNSSFTNSTCNSNTQGSCSHSDFSASSCYAYGGNNSCGDGSTFTDDSTCYGNSTASNRAGTACGNSEYKDSSCYNTSKGGYACGASIYDHSTCYGNQSGGCGGASTYKNNSICFLSSISFVDKLNEFNFSFNDLNSVVTFSN